MRTINSGIGYILLSLLSFIFSGLGFSGQLNPGQVMETRSPYLGVLFLLGGIFFASCYFKNRK